MSDFHSDNCPDIVKEFLLYLETVRNLSPRTIEGYYIDIRTFFRFILRERKLVGADVEFSEICIMAVDAQLVKSITKMDIFNFLHFVMNQRENKPSSRSRKLSSLRAYYKYLANYTNLNIESPLDKIEMPAPKKALPKFLSLDDSLSLLRNISGDSYLRDYCIVTLFLNCGMRLSELVGINIGDIHDDMVRITGKGNKERLVYLNDACKQALDSYISERNRQNHAKEEKALFLSSRGTRISARRVEQIVEKCLAAAGLGGLGYSPHKLRHTAATLMYQYGGADMLALQEILGHENVSTTEIYTHINNKQIKNTMFASPLAHEHESRKPKKSALSNEDDNSDNSDKDGNKES